MSADRPAWEQRETALAKPADQVALGTLRAVGPGELVAGATAIAGELANIIESRKLYNTIGGKRHVRVEGWTTLAALLGCLPREVENVEQDDGSFVAAVELVRMDDGRVISRATAECGMDEDRWKSQPRYARRSMAATRATSKVCRLAFSWTMSLAGFEPTPFEEMPAKGWTDEPSSAASAANVPEVPFGKNKGVPITELTDKQLNWYIKAARENLESDAFAPGGDKHQFVDSEERWLKTLLEEGEKRWNGKKTD